MPKYVVVCTDSLVIDAHNANDAEIIACISLKDTPTVWDRKVTSVSELNVDPHEVFQGAPSAFIETGPSIRADDPEQNFLQRWEELNMEPDEQQNAEMGERYDRGHITDIRKGDLVLIGMGNREIPAFAIDAVKMHFDKVFSAEKSVGVGCIPGEGIYILRAAKD